MIKDDPVFCALYAKENDLLDTPGWKSLKQIATRKKFKYMVGQVTMQLQGNVIIYSLA